MKSILVLCLAALASSAPRPQEEAIEVIEDPAPVDVPVIAEAPVIASAPLVADGPVVAILRDERVDNGDGNFNYAFEADNGIKMEVSGTPGAEGQVNMEGSYLLPLADGSFAEIRFIANENGFQPLGDILPTPHPLPAHAQEQIRIAEQQRAEGITFE